MKLTQKPQGCLVQLEATLALPKHEGGRGRQKRGWPVGASEEERQEERMSIVAVLLSVQNDDGIEKNLSQKIPKVLKISLCVMPM